MQALELLGVLEARGAHLHVLEGGRLGVEPSSVLNGELRGAIRERRDELLELVAKRRESRTPRLGRSGELVIPFACEERFRWWEARTDEEMRARFRAAREAAGATKPGARLTQ